MKDPARARNCSSTTCPKQGSRCHSSLSKAGWSALPARRPASSPLLCGPVCAVALCQQFGDQSYVAWRSDHWQNPVRPGAPRRGAHFDQVLGAAFTPVPPTLRRAVALSSGEEEARTGLPLQAGRVFLEGGGKGGRQVPLASGTWRPPLPPPSKKTRPAWRGRPVRASSSPLLSATARRSVGGTGVNAAPSTWSKCAPRRGAPGRTGFCQWSLRHAT